MQFEEYCTRAMYIKDQLDYENHEDIHESGIPGGEDVS